MREEEKQLEHQEENLHKQIILGEPHLLPRRRHLHPPLPPPPLEAGDHQDLEAEALQEEVEGLHPVQVEVVVEDVAGNNNNNGLRDSLGQSAAGVGADQDQRISVKQIILLAILVEAGVVVGVVVQGGVVVVDMEGVEVEEVV